MSPTQKRILLICILLAGAYFVIFWQPNAAASVDINMVRALSPDEAVPLPYVFNMIKPAGTVKQALINFAFYEYYFYGYPHFALSALVLLPLALADRLGDIPLVMVLLRQLISVLPMLLAVLGLVYLQTRFRSYKAIALYAFLLSIPALVENNFWWHPDSLAILFVVGAILFLDHDNLRFGRSFYLAAAMVGVSAQIKGIGFYFFLAVFVYLLIGYLSKKSSLSRLALASLGFLAVMAVAYFASNPILIYPGVRRDFFAVMRAQSRLLTQGYEIAYARGPEVAWPQVREYFGGALFLLTTLAAALWGVLRGQRRLLYAVILAWSLPLTVLVAFVIHFKPQYWLPVALPLFSCLVSALPERPPCLKEIRSAPRLVLPWLVVLIMLAQFGLYLRSDVQSYNRQLHRTEDPAIAFAENAADALTPLDDEELYIYHEVRMYLPPREHWTTEAIFEMLTYDTIQQRNFDVVMIMQQRINDYLNPNAVAINSEALEKSRVFYRDADLGKLQGYTLIYRDDFGLIFVRDDLYQSTLASH